MSSENLTETPPPTEEIGKETITYENPWFLESLLGHDRSLLKELEARTGVRTTTRDAWLELRGTKVQMESSRRVLALLEEARRQGADITPSLFRFTLETVVNAGPQASLKPVLDAKLLGGPRKPPVLPKTAGQLRYLQTLQKYQVVFGLGPAGTGKTYLAVAHAASLLKAKEINRIILARPAVEAGEALGFLPGDMKEKIFPYLRPLFDALYDILEPSEVEKYIEKGMIEIAPLAYMRGRTLNKSYIILDEAQNTTREQMFMFLTRLGEGSRCCVTGDPTQIDLRPGVRSGLHEANLILRSVDGIAFVDFDKQDVVRNPIVQNIIEAYENARAKDKPEERKRPAASNAS